MGCFGRRQGGLFLCFFAQARRSTFFIAPGEHQIVYIIHGLLLAFLIELIEDNQSYLKHRHLENNESHHQSNHIRQFQDAAKGRLQDNR